MRFIVDYNEWARLSVMTQSHHKSPSLLLFQSYANYAKKYAPRPREGGGAQVHLLHSGKDCRARGLPQECQSVVWQATMKTQNVWLVDGPRQCPNYAHSIPSGQGSASRLL